jgi:hypothetical protein
MKIQWSILLYIIGIYVIFFGLRKMRSIRECQAEHPVWKIESCFEEIESQQAQCLFLVEQGATRTIKLFKEGKLGWPVYLSSVCDDFVTVLFVC